MQFSKRHLIHPTFATWCHQRQIPSAREHNNQNVFDSIYPHELAKFHLTVLSITPLIPLLYPVLFTLKRVSVTAFLEPGVRLGAFWDSLMIDPNSRICCPCIPCCSLNGSHHMRILTHIIWSELFGIRSRPILHKQHCSESSISPNQCTTDHIYMRFYIDKVCRNARSCSPFSWGLCQVMFKYVLTNLTHK